MGLRLKLLFGSVAVLVLAGFGAWLLWRQAPGVDPLGPILLFAALGLIGLTVFHLVFVPRALEPLRELERAARAIRDGNTEVEIETSPFADAEMRQVVAVFNEMISETADLRARLHRLAMRALDTGEEQLREVACRLHDDVAQRLAGIVLRLRVAGQVEDSGERVRILSEVRGEVKEALEELRRLARRLRTPELDDLGLGPALRAFGRPLARRTNLEIAFELEPTNGWLSLHQKIGIYRILQEAMYNTVRHAGARRMEIRVRRRSGSVVAEVVDDGCGFDPECLAGGDAPCLGLLAMRERARHVGGRLRLVSAPGEGTRVRVEIPENEPGSQPQPFRDPDSTSGQRSVWGDSRRSRERFPTGGRGRSTTDGGLHGSHLQPRGDEPDETGDEACSKSIGER